MLITDTHTHTHTNHEICDYRIQGTSKRVNSPKSLFRKFVPKTIPSINIWVREIKKTIFIINFLYTNLNNVKSKQKREHFYFF